MTTDIRPNDCMAKVFQAPSIDEAWQGLLELARGLDISGVVNTQYRQSVSGAHAHTSCRIARIGFDDTRHKIRRLLPTEFSWSNAQPLEIVAVKSSNHDTGRYSPLYPLAQLPIRVSLKTDRGAKFLTEMLGVLLDSRVDVFTEAFVVPVLPADPEVSAEFLNFFSEDEFDGKSQSLVIALACAFTGKLAIASGRHGPARPAKRRKPADGEQDVELRPAELECIRWAVAGKSLQDIADITGITHRTVRYHINRARARYGYATNLQTYVRAALDYGLDPLTPNPSELQDDAEPGEEVPRGALSAVQHGS